MLGRISSLLLALLLCAAGAGGAFAEKRVALVIGNSQYLRAPRLPNPAKDAAAVSTLLESVGFDVVETHIDLRNADMRRVVRDFSDRARDADIAIVFFAGHGIEVRGSNFLVPVDAVLERDLDVEDEAISLDRVLQMIEPAKRLRLVILDACRDNPFIPAMKRTMASRTFGRGLARVEPTSPDTLIAFAAKDGSTAADGDSDNSPFTLALLRHLAEPGLDLQLAFGRVRDDVMKVTSSRQEPFLYGSLGGSTVALVPTSSGQAAATDPAAPTQPRIIVNNAPTQLERDFDQTSKVGTKEAWDAFLVAHPNGLYADLARAQRAKLLALAPSDAAPIPAKGSEPAMRTEPQQRSRTMATPENSRQSPKKHARESKESTRDIPKRRTGGPEPEHCDNIRRALQAARGMGWNTNAGLLAAGKSYCRGG